MLRWIEKPESVGLRLVGYADKLCDLRHKGWFVDDNQDEVMRGVVYALPARRGYVAGYADPWNDGPACLELRAIDDEREAAIQADRISERSAESEREYHEAYQDVARAREAMREASQAVLNAIECARACECADDHDEALADVADAWRDYCQARDEAIDVHDRTLRHGFGWNDF